MAVNGRSRKRKRVRRRILARIMAHPGICFNFNFMKKRGKELSGSISVLKCGHLNGFFFFSFFSMNQSLLFITMLSIPDQEGDLWFVALVITARPQVNGYL